MSKPIVTVSMKAAAEFMGVCPRWARKLLNRRHRQNPKLGLLLRPSGSPEGHIEVNAKALRFILKGGTAQEVEDLGNRVGFCESDIASLQFRLGKIEHAVLPAKQAEAPCRCASRKGSRGSDLQIQLGREGEPTEGETSE